LTCHPTSDPAKDLLAFFNLTTFDWKYMDTCCFIGIDFTNVGYENKREEVIFQFCFFCINIKYALVLVLV